MMVEAAVEKLDSIGDILHTVQHLEVTELHAVQPLSLLHSAMARQRLESFLYTVVLKYFPVASQPVQTQ